MSPKPDPRTAGRLFVLDLSGGRVLSMKTDGSDETVIAAGCHLPDGIAIDTRAGHVYWTNMRTTIVPVGNTFTPKQCHLDKDNSKLYWCDREGMRVMRANLDGSNVETLVDTSQGDPRPGSDATKWCVGITLDPARGHVYWTQKGPDNGELGRIFRAGIDVPRGEKPGHRSDIEVLFERLPEPIDLELDLEHRVLYWTDRGDPPRGNTVNRTPIDRANHGAPEIVMTHLMEGIGLALDVPHDRMFVTDFGGSVYSARLDGSDKQMFLFAKGNLTGVTYAEIAAREK